MDHQGVSSLQRVGWDHRERDEPWTCGGELEMKVFNLASHGTMESSTTSYRGNFLKDREIGWIFFPGTEAICSQKRNLDKSSRNRKYGALVKPPTFIFGRKEV